MVTLKKVLLFIALIVLYSQVIVCDAVSWNIDPETGEKSLNNMDGETKFDPGFNLARFGCDEEAIPINSVRHIEMTDDNYIRYIKLIIMIN